jgi:uncharacterized protein DUF4397
MKCQLILKGSIAAFNILLMSILFSSCEKNDIDDSGTSNLKVVNASPGSQAQSFQLAGKTLISDGLNFTGASGYLPAYAGTRLVAEFKNGNAGSTYASGELWLYKDQHFTVFLAGGNGSERVKLFNDDLSTPDNGKVRVRFIHLSDDAPSDIRIENANGGNLITNLSRNTQSGYKTIDPGTLSFKVYGTAQGKHISDFDMAGLQDGKIYTVYFAGTSNAGTTAHLIQHN